MGKKKRSKKGRRMKDPNAPKKPAPAFLKWSMQERDAIKQDLGNLKPGDMGKELGRRWAELNPGIKQLYHERYQQDKKDYNEAKGQYNPSQEFLRQKGSGAPKKPPPSFLKWSMYERVEVKKDLGNISVTEMGKELGRRWAALTPEVKQVYKERYHQEKEMYNQAMANYVPSEHEMSLKKVKQSKRDPNTPKKPAPAFLKWSVDERTEVKKQLGNLSPAEISKELGKRWANLAPEVKQFYQERYAVEKEEWDLNRKSQSIKAIENPTAPTKPAPGFLIKTEMEQNPNYNSPMTNQVRHQQPTPGHPAIQHQPAEISWQNVSDNRWVTNNIVHPSNTNNMPPSNNEVKKEVKSEFKDYYASFRYLRTVLVTVLSPGTAWGK